MLLRGDRCWCTVGGRSSRIRVTRRMFSRSTWWASAGRQSSSQPQDHTRCRPWQQITYPPTRKPLHSAYHGARERGSRTLAGSPNPRGRLLGSETCNALVVNNSNSTNPDTVKDARPVPGVHMQAQTAGFITAGVITTALAIIGCVAFLVMRKRRAVSPKSVGSPSPPGSAEIPDTQSPLY